MVYVDDMHARYRNMVMCHMVADTIDELHAMAEKIGMKREWFQNSHYPHYDLSKTRRVAAIKHGAKEITMRDAVRILKRSAHA